LLKNSNLGGIFAELIWTLEIRVLCIAPELISEAGEFIEIILEAFIFPIFVRLLRTSMRFSNGVISSRKKYIMLKGSKVLVYKKCEKLG